ncbi:MAG: PilZ domain-containing protein [Rhodospirillales bacterium]|nr:PilZ domain-containing protein [Rhodospirillales bacterium]
MAENNRAHTRYPLSRLVRAVGKEGGESHGGALINISTGGASIKLASPLRRVTHEFEPGMTIDVIIDDFPPLEGDIVRTTENTIAISFFPDTTDQKNLMKNIMAAMEK